MQYANYLQQHNELAMTACATEKKISENVCLGNLILPVPDTDFRETAGKTVIGGNPCPVRSEARAARRFNPEP